MSKRIIKILVYIFSSLLVVELISRFYGLHQYPLFIEDKNYEYIHKANQNTYIYRNHFITNEYSMRSLPIDKKDTLVVLLIGDSILNGTNQVGHEDLASTILEDSLKTSLNKNIRVLNVSSYSWGPDNVCAYLKKYGLFNADLVVFIINSGETYDNMTFEKIVGINQVYTKYNYLLASVKLYLLASVKLVDKGYKLLMGRFAPSNPPALQKNKIFNSGFSNIDSLIKQKNIPFIAYFHADTKESKNRKYSEDGQKIIDFYSKRNRKIIKEIDFKGNEKFYLDATHFNKAGQKFMAKILYKNIFEEMSLKTKP